MILAGTGIAIGSVRPGPQRAFCPACNGLIEIAPQIWTDDADRAAELASLLSQSRENVERFFGDALRRPLMIFCTKGVCAEKFGISAAGFAYGYHLVLLAPRGINERTITHELTHIRLHSAMTARDILNQRFPVWFDEGMATFVARDGRLGESYSKSARSRVQSAEHFWEWDDVAIEMGGWQNAYGAAHSLVQDYAAQHGREGLLTLVADVEAGADFNDLWSMGGVIP